MNHFDTPRSISLRKFLAKEADRIVGLSIEPDGVFIYTDTAEWHDDAGSGTFRGDSETDAIRKFYERVQPSEARAARLKAEIAALAQLQQVEPRRRARKAGSPRGQLLAKKIARLR